MCAVVFHKEERGKAMSEKKGIIIAKWLVSIGVPALLFLLVPETGVITYQIKMYIAITLFTILMWIMNTLPPVITGLVMSLLYIIRRSGFRHLPGVGDQAGHEDRGRNHDGRIYRGDWFADDASVRLGQPGVVLRVD